MQIYLARNQVQAGPYTLDELNNMLQTQEVDLNDLMWHEGMANWQRVGDVTGNRLIYSPSTPQVSIVKDAAPTPAESNNLARTPTQTSDNQARLDKLYGRSGSQNNTTSDKKNSSAKHRFNLKKESVSPKSMGKMVGNNVLASVSNRVLAVFIDALLALASLIPMMSFVMDYADEIKEPGVDAIALANELAEIIPTHLILMTSLMLLGLAIVQIVLLIRRGQTIGKLITGVRVLDVNTMQVPSITNIILLRTILTNIAYNLSVIGIGVMIADFVTMVIDKQHRSLHDKLAKTIVVKADNKQLTNNKTVNKRLEKK